MLLTQEQKFLAALKRVAIETVLRESFIDDEQQVIVYVGGLRFLVSLPDKAEYIME